MNASEFFTPAGHSGLLVGAALAAGKATFEGPIQSDDFGLGIFLLHNRSVWVTTGATHAAETIGVFQGVKDLFFPLEVSELGQGLAPEKLLETTAPGLSQNELLALGKMGFHGIRAAVVHSVGLHD